MQHTCSEATSAACAASQSQPKRQVHFTTQKAGAQQKPRCAIRRTCCGAQRTTAQDDDAWPNNPGITTTWLLPAGRQPVYCSELFIRADESSKLMSKHCGKRENKGVKKKKKKSVQLIQTQELRGDVFACRFFGGLDDDRKRTLNSPRTARARAS